VSLSLRPSAAVRQPLSSPKIAADTRKQ